MSSLPDASSQSLRDRLQQALRSGYTIERELGGGGMSRVFVAEEHALRRRVVIKVLPEVMAGQVSIERFKREIALAAQLQHPHVVPLLTAGDADGLPYFTMPFIESDSLRARLIRDGELPIGEAIRVLREVASALAYAHTHGVVHRDIKPDNILIAGGSAMVTDFGVAKALSASADPMSTGITSVGVALGTPAYMAPEQAAADPHIDHRADIYAFGAMAYEMLTGQPPFAGRSHQALLAAHVTEEPELMSRRRSGSPVALTQLVMRCLAKRPADRPQTAQDIMLALDVINTPTGGTQPTGARRQPMRPSRRRAMVAASALVVLVAVAIGRWITRASFVPYQTGNVRQVATGAGLIEFEPTISPDHIRIAYAARVDSVYRIYVRAIEGGTPRRLVTGGDVTGDQRWPRWSPDGLTIVFAANGAAYTVSSEGGAASLAITSPTKSVSTPNWSPDSRQFVYADSGGILVQSVSGGAARYVIHGEFLHAPVWSPDSTRIAYVAGQPRTLINMSSTTIWVVPVSGERPQRISDLTHVNMSPAWAADGRSLLYLSNPDGTTDLFQQAVRPDGSAAGKPHRLFTAVDGFTMTMSGDGTRLAYDVVRDYTGIWTSPVSTGTTAKTSGATPITNQDEHIESLDLSPDGQWLAYDSNVAGNFDIYKVSASGGDPQRLTSDPANAYHPAWSPDGKEIAYYSTRNGGMRHIYAMSSEGTNNVQLTRGTPEDFAPRWSPNGRSLVFVSQVPGTDVRKLFTITRDANGHWSAPHKVTPDSLQDVLYNSAWSPDGKDIAFLTDRLVAIVPSAGGSPRILATNTALQGQSTDLAWITADSAVYVRVLSTPGIIIAIPAKGGPIRSVLKDDAAHPFAWVSFATDSHRIFFTLGPHWQAGVNVMDLKH